MKESPFYSKKSFLLGFLSLCALALACAVSAGGAIAILIPIALVAIVQGKNEMLMYILLVAVCAMIGNYYFFPKGLVFAICQKVLMLATSSILVFSVFGRRNSSLITPLLWLVPYLVYMVLVSQVGWKPIVSNLKLFLFCSIYFGLYGCAVKVMQERSDIRKMRSMVLAVAAFFICGSVALIPFPGISMMTSEAILLNPDLKSFFMGMTMHSQSLGPIVTMFSVFLFADYIFSVYKKDKLYLLILLCCPLLVYKTASRTAMASYLLGMMFVVYLAMISKGLSQTRRQKLVTNSMLLVVLAAICVLAIPQLRDKATQFAIKYNESDGSVVVTKESLFKSRQAKYDMALANWKQSPLIGNGFQVSEEMSQNQYTSIKSILTAPVEKCTWVYAVLEEGGVIGMILFVMFLVFTTLSLVRRRAYIGAAMMLEVALINLGEFVVFSMSAIGGVMWALVFIGIAFDHKRLELQRRFSFPPPLR